MIERNASPKLRAGFTLVELVVVIVIAGVLAAVAAPKFLDRGNDASAAAELSNVNAIMEAAQLYEADNGKPPGDEYAGRFPPDFEGYLAPEIFTNRSPSGGIYDWNGPPAHTGTSIGLQLVATGGAKAREQLFYTKIEAAFDDGNAMTGWIRANNRRIFFKY